MSLSPNHRPTQNYTPSELKAFRIKADKRVVFAALVV